MNIPKSTESYPLRGPRTSRSLAIEDAVLTAGTYAIFVAWHFGVISYLALQLLMLVAIFRVFNLRHEKAHLPHASFSRTWNFLTSLCWVFHSPYQEPYLDKRRKHLAHHKGHLIARPVKTCENPHSLLEQPSFARSFLVAAFYEEVMFYQDWKFHGGLSPARRGMFFLASTALVLLGALFGLKSLLVLIVSYRICMALAWFSFSKMLHIEPFYGDPLIERLPKFIVRGLELLLGSGSATALLAHEFHHHVPLKFHRVFASAPRSAPTPVRKTSDNLATVSEIRALGRPNDLHAWFADLG